jgi:hypothetical protein
MGIIFFIALYYKMTTGIFNDRALSLVESLAQAIKEEVDLVKENKINNPKSDHKGSVSRAAINFVQSNVQRNYRISAKAGVLGSSYCSPCHSAWLWDLLKTRCTSGCRCNGGCKENLN